ncbi:unnamed protein product [Candida parapsilosis]
MPGVFYLFYHYGLPSLNFVVYKDLSPACRIVFAARHKLSAKRPLPACYGLAIKVLFLSSKMCRAKISLSSMDSDLEAFSHNPADGSFAALPDQTAAKTNYSNERFLSY